MAVSARMSRLLGAYASAYRAALALPVAWLSGQLFAFFAVSLYVKLAEMRLTPEYGASWIATGRLFRNARDVLLFSGAEIGLFALLLATVAVWDRCQAVPDAAGRALAWTAGFVVLPTLSIVEVTGLSHFALFNAPLGPDEVRLVGWSGHFISAASVLQTPTVAAGLMAIAVGYYVAPCAAWLGPARVLPLRRRRSIAGALVLGAVALAVPKPAIDSALLAPHPVLWLAFGGQSDGVWDGPAPAEGATPAANPSRAHVVPNVRPTNVLVLVLESTRAASVALYDPAARAGRELLALADETVIFDQVYAPAPTSAHALFSIFYGVYPYVGPFWMGTDKAVALESLAEVFGHAGYATQLYVTSDLAFDDVRSFAARGFDRVLDTNDWPGQERVALLPWGRDDRLLVDEVERFLANRDARPFFMVAMTSNPHHPYAVGELPGETPESDPHAAYDRLVAYDLRLVAELYQWMKDHDVAEQTLLLVLGDHGEAFGEHAGNFGHAAGIYEENTHIPCFILHPRRLGLAPHVAQLGSEVDVRATILDILGLPDGETGDGTSLLADDPSRAVFNFTENGIAHYGMRDADFTYISTPHVASEKLFDRRHDPAETHDLGPEEPAVTQRYRARLQQWEAQHALRLAKVLR
jgi:lipoteichoic acid synthase